MPTLILLWGIVPARGESRRWQDNNDLSILLALVLFLVVIKVRLTIIVAAVVTVPT